MRDALLTPSGMQDTLARAEAIAEASLGDATVLLVVSPLTRAILTAVLGFHRLAERKRVHVVLEPAAAEVINSPHDLIENIGRPMEVVFAECEACLAAVAAPPGASALLAQLRRAARALPPRWWAKHCRDGQLPVRVFNSEAHRRRETLVAQTARHVLPRLQNCEQHIGRCTSCIQLSFCILVLSNQLDMIMN